MHFPWSVFLLNLHRPRRFMATLLPSAHLPQKPEPPHMHRFRTLRKSNGSTLTVRFPGEKNREMEHLFCGEFLGVRRLVSPVAHTEDNSPLHRLSFICRTNQAL
jgi:hypothetical protein